MWYGNSSNQDCKALQRNVHFAERISGSALPSPQDIYLKRCKSRAAKITRDSNHPGNRLFILLPSGMHFRSMMAKTERLRRSFFPQAPKLKLSLITSRWLHLIISKIYPNLHHLYFCYVYTLYNLFAHYSCTSLLILLFIKSTVYCPAHCILLHILLFIFSYYFGIFYLCLCLSSCVVLHILHCPLSGPDLTYISLLIIFCIIEYVTNKKTLDLDLIRWTHTIQAQRDSTNVAYRKLYTNIAITISQLNI